MQMRFRKVLLVFPQYKNTQFGANHPPVGLGYLSEFLKENGIDHDVFDMRLGRNVRKLIPTIRRIKPEIIGISMMTLLHKNTYKLIKKIKDEFPNIAIVVGGPHVSTLKEHILHQCFEIDFGITREGEETLLELCQNVEYGKIKGLIYRQNDQVIYTGDRDFIKNLDSLPFPKYEKFEVGKYVTDEIPILTSRGCPYKCIYCPVKTAIGERFRVRSYPHIISEIQYWREKGHRHFGIIDDNFLMLKERVMSLCQEIIDRRFDDMVFRCPNGIRADRCDNALLSKMRETGFRYIAIGVEAGNNKILERIKKGESIEVIKTAIKNACDLGFEVILFFIVGSPGETWSDLEDSVNIALAYPIFDAKFYNLIPFPDTELFKWIQENDYFVREPDDYLNDASHWDKRPVFATPELSVEERVKALHYTSQVRKKIRQKAMERKLRKLGILSKPLAQIFTLEPIQYLLLHNSYLRRFGTCVFRVISK